MEPEYTSTNWIKIVAERRIEEAIEQGVFDNLPGKGKPLVFEDDPLTPMHLRVVNHVLKNARVVPTWVSLEQEIEQAKDCADLFRDSWRRVQSSDPIVGAQARAAYEKLLRRANDLILRFNLVTPFVHRAPIPFRIKLRMEEWDAMHCRGDRGETAGSP